MITIKDLAKHCGVSVTTVSYALNDSPEVSQETKERIRKAAIELNYFPSGLAKGLKKNKTNCIGILITGFEGTAHSNILSGLAKSFQKNGNYQMLVTIADKNISIVRTRMVDLAIIMDASINDETLISISRIVPVVTFDKNVTGNNIYPTFIKNIESIYELTSKLIKSGCKKIAYLLGSSASNHNLLRFKGYTKALEDNNIRINNDIVYDANSFTKEAGFKTILDALQMEDGKLPFDAIVCGNDELALGAISALNEFGYSVPKDVKITGFDNILEGSLTHPTLTTVDVDWVMYGEKMGDFAIDILENKQLQDNYLLIDTKIIERESSKKAISVKH